MNEGLDSAQEIETKVRQTLLNTLTTPAYSLLGEEVLLAAGETPGLQGPSPVWNRSRHLLPLYLDREVKHIVRWAQKRLHQAPSEPLATLLWPKVAKALESLQEALVHGVLATAVKNGGPTAARAKDLLWRRLFAAQIFPVASTFCRTNQLPGLEPEDLCQDFYLKKFDYLLLKYVPEQAPLASLLSRALHHFFVQLARSSRPLPNPPAQADPAPSPVQILGDEEHRRAVQTALNDVCRHLVEKGYPYDKMLAFRLRVLWDWQLDQIQLLSNWTGKDRSLTSIHRDVVETGAAIRREFLLRYPALAEQVFVERHTHLQGDQP